MLDLKLKATPNEARVFATGQFALVLVAAWWLNHSGYSTLAVCAALLSGGVLLAGWIRPAWISGLYAAWMLAAFPIGWIMSYVVAGVVYFGVITPIGLLMRLTGRDSLGLRFDPKASTYWVNTEDEEPDPARYFRQF